uniref:Uncharacterized protein n=1 Tax=Rhizophora mucronata TaxID=61149 RepID=A0A2P2JJ59_RHIMU
MIITCKEFLWSFFFWAFHCNLT